jgi:hypothetical protein
MMMCCRSCTCLPEVIHKSSWSGLSVVSRLEYRTNRKPYCTTSGVALAWLPLFGWGATKWLIGAGHENIHVSRCAEHTVVRSKSYCPCSRTDKAPCTALPAAARLATHQSEGLSVQQLGNKLTHPTTVGILPSRHTVALTLTLSVL